MGWETLTFATRMLGFDVPLEPFLPRECYKWLQTGIGRAAKHTYTRCILAKCTNDTQKLLSALMRLDTEAKRRCDQRPWSSAEQRKCERALGRSRSVVSTAW